MFYIKPTLLLFILYYLDPLCEPTYLQHFANYFKKTNRKNFKCFDPCPFLLVMKSFFGCWDDPSSTTSLVIFMYFWFSSSWVHVRPSRVGHTLGRVMLGLIREKLSWTQLSWTHFMLGWVGLTLSQKNLNPPHVELSQIHVKQGLVGPTYTQFKLNPHRVKFVGSTSSRVELDPCWVMFKSDYVKSSWDRISQGWTYVK